MAIGIPFRQWAIIRTGGPAFDRLRSGRALKQTNNTMEQNIMDVPTFSVDAFVETLAADMESSTNWSQLRAAQNCATANSDLFSDDHWGVLLLAHNVAVEHVTESP
jgi:hypothetical protein